MRRENEGGLNSCNRQDDNENKILISFNLILISCINTSHPFLPNDIFSQQKKNTPLVCTLFQNICAAI